MQNAAGNTGHWVWGWEGVVFPPGAASQRIVVSSFSADKGEMSGPVLWSQGGTLLQVHWTSQGF